MVKWLDFGKDHYACVTMGNTPGRVVALPWMSNWQYANVTPIKQYRGANALPRELKLYTRNGQIYLSADVVKEADALRKESVSIDNIKADKKGTVRQLPTTTAMPMSSTSMSPGMAPRPVSPSATTRARR